MKDIDEIINEMWASLKKSSTDLLDEASPNDMKAVSDKWNLPNDYLYFLSQYSPLGLVEWDNEGYFSLNICSAKDLLSAQNGYAYDPLTKKKIEDWPQSYLVIATSNGDPFCIDLECDKTPVFTAMHGEGQWDFYEDSPAIIDFLKKAIA